MESEAIGGVISVQEAKGLISLELNRLDSRFNKTRFLNMDDAQKVLLHTGNAFPIRSWLRLVMEKLCSELWLDLSLTQL